MSLQVFIKPFDIFMPRGNKHFGVSSGDFGQIQMLPAPSVFAGALRSFLASRKPEVLQAIMTGKPPSVPEYARVLGSLQEPGSFRVAQVCLARQQTAESATVLWPAPADLVVFGQDDQLDVRYLAPQPRPSLVETGCVLPKISVLKAPTRKPSGRFWLKNSGYTRYLNGQKPQIGELVQENTLWKKEMRVGIALQTATRTTEDGLLYAAEAVSLRENIGFLVMLEGCGQLLPEDGDLSLGGDQRAAHFTRVVATLPQVDHQIINREKRFKLVLTSPAIFVNGWIPDLLVKNNDDFFLKTEDFSARLVCAAIPGMGIASGWNMVTSAPKTAMRTVPAGSVYWFEDFTGDVDALEKIVKQGLWQPDYDKQRLVEGFNRAVLAAYEIK